MILITNKITSSQKDTQKNIYSSTSNELHTVYLPGINECTRNVFLISEGLLWLAGGFRRWGRSGSGVLLWTTTTESAVFYNVLQCFCDCNIVTLRM